MELSQTIRRENVRLSDVLDIGWNRLSNNFADWLIITLTFMVLGWGGTIALQGAVLALFGGGSAVFGGGQTEPNVLALVGAMVGNLLSGSIASIWVGLLGLGYWSAALRCVLGLSISVKDLFGHLAKVVKYVVQVFLVQGINGVFALLALAVFAVAVLDMIDIKALIDVRFADLADRFDAAFAMQLVGRIGWVILLISIPFVYVVLGLFFAKAELTYNDTSGPVSSIVNSWRIASKHRLQMIGLGVVVGICFIAGLIPCGLGLLVAIPFGSLCSAALFLALRNGADVPPADTTMTLRGEASARRSSDVAAVDGDHTPGGALS